MFFFFSFYTYLLIVSLQIANKYGIKKNKLKVIAYAEEHGSRAAERQTCLRAQLVKNSDMSECGGGGEWSYTTAPPRTSSWRSAWLSTGRASPLPSIPVGRFQMAYVST
jgi:hypothetical protein